MRKVILSILVSCSLFLGACSTIHFHNGEDATKAYEQENWHHIGVLSLVEFSDPVNLKQACEDSAWESVRTQKAGLQVLVHLLAGWIYSPEEVSVACSK